MAMVMATSLAELYLSPANLMTSRIHGVHKEYEKSRRCCLQTPRLKIRSFSSQDLRSKVAATPITISSRRSKCVPKAASDAKAFFPGSLRAGHVHTKMSMPMPTLEVYGTNLTKLAEQGKLYLAGKVSRAESEELVVLRLIVQLLGYQSSCAVLVGGYRVGKTSIVEGLARRIASGDVPDAMKCKQVIKLDMSLLLAGTKHPRDQLLKERLKKLIAEIKKSGEIILFIDEVNFLTGAAAAAGSQGAAAAAANILKSAISSGELKWFIGASSC